MNLNGLAAAGIFGGIVLLFLLVHVPGVDLAGAVPIPSSLPTLVGWAGPHDAVAKDVITDRKSGAVLAEFLRGPDGVLRQTPDAFQRSAVDARETPILSFGQRLDRIGTFAAYYNRHDAHSDRFQVGAHYEPCTLFFGTVALPSLAITRDLAGVGATVHLPPRAFPTLSHLGVGAWECVPFRGGAPGLLVGATFHIDLP